MDSILFSILTLLYLGLLILGMFLAKQSDWFFTWLTLLFVILGLMYDNLVLALGKYIGKGELLENLNMGRYWLHAFLTPLLVIFSIRSLHLTDWKWPKRKGAMYAAVLLTTVLVIVEIVTVVFGLKLEAIWQHGVLSYENDGQIVRVPIMVLVVTLVLTITSIILWWKLKWKTMFIGVAVMGIGNGIQLPIQSNATGNFFELFLITTLFLTAFYQFRKIPKN
ncbi:hypothetical protein [Oceanobacillus halophilus]|uniref:Phospholipid phosphatase n=1 Tax=Oceanobacillus halophilus TaxID=930130 RepID=A0A495A2W2_9BACI|nr:hypothetical protein [Oceanobacillus halophilus]RKQ33266.1 hypothetical protein D8M06_10865 [Oceanobacillus halophilus]